MRVRRFDCHVDTRVLFAPLRNDEPHGEGDLFAFRAGNTCDRRLSSTASRLMYTFACMAPMLSCLFNALFSFFKSVEVLDWGFFFCFFVFLHMEVFAEWEKKIGHKLLWSKVNYNSQMTVRPTFFRAAAQ